MRFLAASALALFLVGCGGDGGSSGTPTPTPAPTPAPTPSPTPAPTPTPYASAYPGNADFSTSGIGALLSRTVTGGTRVFAAELQADTTRVGFDYTAATRTYRARYNGDTLTTATVRETETNGAVTLDTETADTASVFFARLNLLNAGVDFVGGVLWDNPPAETSGSVARRLFVFGSPTRNNDLPATGTLNYTGPAFLSVETSAGPDSAVTAGTLNVNWATGAITGTIQLGNSNLQVSGTVDRTTGAMNGTLTEVAASGGPVAGGFTGTFTGDAYGPQAINSGIVFRAVSADARRAIIGALIQSTAYRVN